MFAMLAQSLPYGPTAPMSEKFAITNLTHKAKPRYIWLAVTGLALLLVDRPAFAGGEMSSSHTLVLKAISGVVGLMKDIVISSQTLNSEGRGPALEGFDAGLTWNKLQYLVSRFLLRPDVDLAFVYRVGKQERASRSAELGFGFSLKMESRTQSRILENQNYSIGYSTRDWHIRSFWGTWRNDRGFSYQNPSTLAGLKVFSGQFVSAFAGLRASDRLATLNVTQGSDDDDKDESYPFNPLFYSFSGFTLFIGGCIALLYIWRKMNLDLSLNMHTPRYFALLLSATALIGAGVVMLATQP